MPPLLLLCALLSTASWAQDDPPPPDAPEAGPSVGGVEGGIGGLIGAADTPPVRLRPVPGAAPEAPAVAPAPPGGPRLAFAGLQTAPEAAIAKGAAQVTTAAAIHDTLRPLGFSVPEPAEAASVFQLEDDDARFVLGGRVLSARCATDVMPVGCEVEVRWEILDTTRREVVHVARVAALAAEPGGSFESLGTALRWSARRLVSLPAARRALGLRDGEAQAAPGAPAEAIPPVDLRRCDRAVGALPAGLQAALSAAVELSHGSSRGMGVIVSPDGWALTAAHVVGDRERVRARLGAGITLDADVVRTDPIQDVALVRLRAEDLPCLPVADALPRPGDDLWVLGAARGDDGFSVARGVVSALRDLETGRYLQTDAGLSPGDSGGGLLDAQGRVVAVTSWKIAGTAYEGLAYGVPIDAAAARLGLRFGERSTADLDGVRRLAPAAAEDDALRDPLHLDAWARARRAERADDPVLQRLEARQTRQRATARGLVLGGLGGAVVGTGLYVGSLGRYLSGRGEQAARPIGEGEWRTLQGLSTGGLVALGVGSGLAITGLVLGRNADGLALVPTASGVQLAGSFR